MREVLQELRDHVGARREKLPQFGDLGARMALTIARFVAASARGSDRSVANANDVTLAARFGRRKLQALEDAETNRRIAAAQPTSPREAETQRRCAWFVETFGGREATMGEMCGTYAKAHGQALPKATFHRIMARVAAHRAQHGRYIVPAKNSKSHTSRKPARSLPARAKR